MAQSLNFIPGRNNVNVWTDILMSKSASEASRKILIIMHIFCANFLNKSAYWTLKKFTWQNYWRGTCPLCPPPPPGSYAHVMYTCHTDKFSFRKWVNKTHKNIIRIVLLLNIRNHLMQILSEWRNKELLAFCVVSVTLPYFAVTQA